MLADNKPFILESEIKRWLAKDDAEWCLGKMTEYLGKQYIIWINYFMEGEATRIESSRNFTIKIQYYQVSKLSKLITTF